MRTLWLSGFPLDVKHREIHNLFRPYRGYEDSILKPNGVAFVTFTSHEAAVAAKSDITGLHFDPDGTDVLKVEFAKQNSKRRREAEESASPEFWSKEREAKRIKRALAGGGGGGGGPTSIDVNAMYRAGLAGYPFNPPSMYGLSSMGPVPDAYLLGGQDRLPKPAGKSLVRFPPGSTLFISNLGTASSEQEISEVFGAFQGFVRAQLYNRGHNINAFVQYKDYESSTQALNHLQGSVLMSSDKGPMKIEYAKNPMVIRKEDQGPYGL